MAQASSSTSTASASTEPIHVSVINGEAFVWSAASIALLRRHYGIVGLLTGSLPLIPQQNAFLGVPLQLFEEEVVYLLRRRAIILVDDIRAHEVDQLFPETLIDWHEKRRTSLSESRQAAVDEARANKKALLDQHATSEAALMKKRQREERRSKELEDQSHLEVSSTKSETNATVTAEDHMDVSLPIKIPSSSDELEWHNLKLGDNAFQTLSSAAKSGLWRYPETADQRAKCAAFEALRAKDYYLGKGLRFGGDFVVYPGDPLRYHSHFTATVQTTPKASISAHEIIAAGRLGTAVKKAHLLCSVKLDEEELESSSLQRRLNGKDDDIDNIWGQVEFISLTWAGFGV